VKSFKRSGDEAYNTVVASSYEADRETEEIWHVEQSYMAAVVDKMPYGSSVLDIPVGTGRFIPFYGRARLEVTGVDVSPAMLAEASRKLDDMNVAVAMVLGNVHRLAFVDQQFEYVVCWRLLHLVPPEELGTVISELARVSNGSLYVQAYVRDRWHFVLRFKNAILRPLKRLFGGNSKSAKWQHIRSFSHKESLLIELFLRNGLAVRAVDSIGTYGSLKVKVYVLQKL
jgi:ubiquinone/menaquinone biosynthesis C-methylase UbiE